MKLTKESLAALLNGRQYGDEITKAEEADAKVSGLVVVFGYSDDNVEFRGAIHDEVGCWQGSDLMMDRIGPIPDWDSVKDSKEEATAYLQRESKSVALRVVWCGGNGDRRPAGGFFWTYETDLPHATFDIMEDEEKFCRGIVFELASLPA